MISTYNLEFEGNVGEGVWENHVYSCVMVLRAIEIRDLFC